MAAAASVTAGVLLGLVVVQSVLVWGFVRALRKFEVPLIADLNAPRATVIQCLRGSDPFLGDCLRGLLGQNYPHFDVRVIVDSPEDPAHTVLNQVVQELRPPNLRVENLVEKSPHCSLKCSSLRQVMSSLEPDCEMVAFLDADTIAHPMWLRELATALQPSDVGVATGNRWYMPQKLSVGSVVRYAWNAAAIVQMYHYRIAWGGTLALKVRVVRESGLLEKWGQALCEDTMLHAQLKKSGMRVAFSPSLMMINRENTSLGGFFTWVSRQLLTAKLYHPAWPAVVLHGVVSTLVPWAVAAMFVVGIANQNIAVMSISLAAIVVYAVSLVLALWPMEHAVRRIVASRGELSHWVSGWGMMKCAAIMPLTQVVYPAALVVAMLAKSTNWRGIHYKIDGPWEICMKQYRPYRPEVVLADESL